MSEAGFWNTVKPALFGWDPVRIEAVGKGHPDVNYVHGWIELKQVDEWPKRPETPLRVPHYTPEQRVWHVRRCSVGGRCHVLIKVKNDILLFWGDVAANHLGHLPKEELLKHACAHWTTRQKWKKELKSALLQDRRHPDLFDPR